MVLKSREECAVRRSQHEAEKVDKVSAPNKKDNSSYHKETLALLEQEKKRVLQDQIMEEAPSSKNRQQR